MLPSPKGLCLFGATIPTSALAIAFSGGQNIGLALCLPALAILLLGLDYAFSLPSKSLLCKLSAPSFAYLGENIEALMDIEAKGWKKSLPLWLILECKGHIKPQKEPFGGTLSQGRLSMRLPVKPTRRGAITLVSACLSYRGPLGFCQISKRIAIGQTIETAQNVKNLNQAALAFFSREAVSGLKNQPFKGEGSEFESLTEWAPGMDNRYIDWKHSAKHHKLLAKEFRQERNHHIILGFDTGRLMTESVMELPRLDHFIWAGLLLAWVSLRSGDLVGSCGFDLTFRSYLSPGRGPSFFSRLQKFTAGLDYRTDETNFTLCLTELSARLKRRSLIVLFTEFSDAVAATLLLESLEILARKHMVVFVTSPGPLLESLRDNNPDSLDSLAQAVIADSFIKERSIVLERLTRLGVQTLDAPPGHLGPGLLNKYLMIKQRDLL
jgi:uncharacterized protein (DUF58 family)